MSARGIGVAEPMDDVKMPHDERCCYSQHDHCGAEQKPRNPKGAMPLHAPDAHKRCLQDEDSQPSDKHAGM